MEHATKNAKPADNGKSDAGAKVNQASKIADTSNNTWSTIALGGSQSSLTIGKSGDAFEQEADSVSRDVLSGKPTAYASSNVSVGGGVPEIQRDPATNSSKSGVANNPSTSVIAGQSAGKPLQGSMRSRIEPSLGSDLSGVRVHKDKHSRNAADGINAKAFTHQSHIYLGSGQSDTDLSLMAHEATHTVQQQGRSSPSIQRDPTNSTIDNAYAQGLDDGSLMYEMQLIESIVSDAGDSSEEHENLFQNLETLRTEYTTRDPGANTTGATTSPSVMSGSGLDGLIPEGGVEINEVGVVAWDSEPRLRLRSSPDTSSPDNIIGHLGFSSRVQIIKSFPGDWYFVSTVGGYLGYVAANYIFRDPPEDNARLHRVEPGVSGTAIGIAERYYGEYGDDWGQDLRFYVNVLAWANGIEVSNTTTGWRSVHFQAGQLIWIPSQPFAYGLKGSVNSGSLSYNIADAVGLAGAIERIGELRDDFKTAVSRSREYVWESITHHMTEAMWAMAEGLVYLLLGAVAILAISTAIGAAIGALAGGAGAAPGAAAGFEVGMVIIEWLGLAMLVVWIVQSLIQLGSAFGTFLGTVWDARGNDEILDRGAHEFADAIGLLVAKIFEALLMYVMAKGLPKGLEALRGTKLGRALGESRASTWLRERSASIEAGEAPLPGPQQVAGRLLNSGRPGAEPAPVTNAGQTQHFHNLPPERLPANLPEGHFWMRNNQGEWVIMREAGVAEVPFELSVYSDGVGNTNYVLRSGDRMIQSDAVTRQGGTYEQGQQRLPEEISATGEANPYRDPVTGEVWDKGHGVDYADTLEGPGVRSSTTDPVNFTPQTSWWNRGPRNTLVGRIRNGHAGSGRTGGGGYREMAIYAENPPVTANGTPIPREFVFVETTRAGVPQRAWRIPNQSGAGTRSFSSINQHAINLSQVPPVLLRTGLPVQAPSGSMSFAPFIVFGVRGDDEGGHSPEQTSTEYDNICVDESNEPASVDEPVEEDWCEAE